MSLSSPLYLQASLEHGVLWPCAVRYSARVKRAKISVDGQGFAELIFPEQRIYTLAQAEKFLQSMVPWLQKTINSLVPQALQAERAEQCLQKITGCFSTGILPASINLPLLNAVWHVYIQPKRGGYVKLQELKGEHGAEGGQVILYAHDTEVKSCCKLLQKWLVKKSLPVLQEKTLSLAHDLHLHVEKVSVGVQKGRWGSCSAKGNIRLNCRLMLLPTYLAEHVILHELCHLVHMNHSKAFKDTLEKVSPNSLLKDKELVRSWKELPLWVIVS